MKHLNIGEAKRHWDRIVHEVDTGQVEGYVLCKRGRPQALLVPLLPEQRVQ